MRFITACIDGSELSGNICDAAVWAAQQLKAPIRLLHALEKEGRPAREDYSGTIGLGSREHLLDTLTRQDEERGRSALANGKALLANASLRVKSQGVSDFVSEQRHGELTTVLSHEEQDSRLLVVGRHGTGHQGEGDLIGAHIESLVRQVSTPILMATGAFLPPTRFMIAYDGSEVADKAIARFAGSPLLKNIPGDLVMVGDEIESNRNRLSLAAAVLRQQGYTLDLHLIPGEIVPALSAFQRLHGCDLKVMGAYGHSRLREFFVGSQTTRMIRESQIPLLLLR